MRQITLAEIVVNSLKLDRARGLGVLASKGILNFEQEQEQQMVIFLA